ncbi:hypothetical protein AGDE_03236 [Angomonas deanei]|uniref:Uncharacterized protein n=1 Tax=Angomonas deanei TaxID=59799 RepID=A0A7G2C5Z2_9TRYP|nr:hypothetical protein AGDE_03236 [Angomonas deanei]CAD2213292.1 hypothetical protein, conserved [Angomonas deanei]|eukprot:EPY40691.1 hypothetical protein AGDE_03236 [Angomonas deanei]
MLCTEMERLPRKMIRIIPFFPLPPIFYQSELIPFLLEYAPIMDPQLIPNSRVRKVTRGSRVNFTKFVLPLTCVFALGGILYSFKWNSDRQKNGVCLSCERQREMMDEVYGGKPKVQKVSRL